MVPLGEAAFPAALEARCFFWVEPEQFVFALEIREIESAWLVAPGHRCVDHGVVIQEVAHRHSGQDLSTRLVAAEPGVEVVGGVRPLVETQPAADLPLVHAVGRVGECSEVALLAVSLLERCSDATRLGAEADGLARPHAGTGRHFERAPQRTGEIAIGRLLGSPPDQVGVHGLVVARVVHAAEPLHGTVTGRGEADLLGDDVHFLRPEEVEQPLLADVQVAVPVAVRPGVGTHGYDIHVFQFPRQFEHGRPGLALVPRIGARVDHVGVVQRRVQLPDPGVVGPLELVPADRGVDRHNVPDRATHRDSVSRLLRCPHVRIVVVAHAIDAWAVGIGEIAIVGRGESEHAQCPVVAECLVVAALEIDDPLVAKDHLDAPEAVLRVRSGTDELDRAADVAAAVERALRTLQYLDPIKIPEPRRRVGKDLYVVEVEPRPLRVAKRPEAADGHVREPVQPNREVQVGNLESDVFEALESLGVDVVARDRHHRLRNLEQTLLALAGRDQHLLDVVVRRRLFRHRVLSWNGE